MEAPSYRLVLGAALGVLAFALVMMLSLVLSCHSGIATCDGSGFHPFLLVIFGVAGVAILLAALALHRAIQTATWYRPWHRYPLFAAVAALLPKVYLLATGSDTTLRVSPDDPIDLALTGGGLAMAAILFAVWRPPLRSRSLPVADVSPEAGRHDPAKIGLAIAVVMLPALVDGFFRRELHSFSPVAYWTFDVARFVVLPLAVAVWLAAANVRPKDYGIRRIAENETWTQFLALSLFLVTILDAVYFVVLFTGNLLLRPEPVPAFYTSINPEGMLRIPVTVYMAATAAVVEEVFCRGLPLLYLQRRFPEKVPARLYVGGTAVLFAAVHWENGAPSVAACFAFGLLAATLYLRLRDLWPLIAAHFVIDLIWLG